MTPQLPVGDPDTPPDDPWPHSPYPQPEPHIGRGGAGLRIPRWLISVGAVTMVLAVLAFIGALAWPFGPEPVDPTTVPAFRPVGQPVRSIPFSGPAERAFAQVAGSRAYVAWQTGDALTMTAVDLTADLDSELWTIQVAGQPGRFWSRLLATPSVVIALGSPPEPEQPDDPDTEPEPGPLPMVVLSAEDGSVRWEREIHEYDQVWLAEQTLVLVDRSARAIRGLDLDTGDQRWGMAFPGGRQADANVVPVLTAAHLTSPSPLHGQPEAEPYQQVVMITEDYTARVLDTTDGGVVSMGTNVAHPDDLLFAYQDQLFVAYDYEGYRVDQRDLGDLSAQPRHVYLTPDTTRRPIALSLCGDDQLCLLDHAGGEGQDIEVRAIGLDPDRTGDPQVWRSRVPYAYQLLAVGEWLVVGGDAALVGFDRDGQEVFRQPEGGAGRIAPDRLLVFATSPMEYPQDLAVAGFPVHGQRVELGQLTGVRGAWCGWNNTYLVCPREEDAGIWRFI